jgi:hypothetical protein
VEEIVLKFSKYKWELISDIAKRYVPQDGLKLDYMIAGRATRPRSMNYTDWEEFKNEISKDIALERRNARLSCNDFTDYLEKEKYCLWVHIYKIKELNLRLCDGCYGWYRYYSGNSKGNISMFNHLIVKDHWHYVVDTDKLHTYYHKQRMWCQNCFKVPLFKFYDNDECEELLHSHKRKRFIDDEDSESD